MRHCDATTRAPKLAATFVAGASLMLTSVSCADDSAGPEQGVDVEAITENYFDDNEFVGQTVTVSAEVSRVLSPQSFQLAGDDWGDDSLLVVSADNADVQEGEVVEVTGQVHDAFAHDSVAQDIDLAGPGLYGGYVGENYLAADTVRKI